MATASFLCLVKPADQRVPGWLADALEFAEKVGDRSRELTVLTTLAWHLFFRSFCGGPGSGGGSVEVCETHGGAG